MPASIPQRGVNMKDLDISTYLRALYYNIVHKIPIVLYQL